MLQVKVYLLFSSVTLLYKGHQNNLDPVINQTTNHPKLGSHSRLGHNVLVTLPQRMLAPNILDITDSKTSNMSYLFPVFIWAWGSRCSFRVQENLQLLAAAATALPIS